LWLTFFTPGFGTFYFILLIEDANGQTVPEIIEGGTLRGTGNGSGWTQLTYCFASLSVAADGGGQMLTIDGDGTLWIAMNFGASGWAHASVPKSTPVISATSINSSSRIYAVV
jgi:hypothetical protein